MNKQVADARPDAPVTALTPTTTATAKLIAELQGGDVTAIEAALVSVRGAIRGGNAAQAEAMLVEQAALLQALATKLFRYAGNRPESPLASTFLGLGLRALDLSRKSLVALAPSTPHAPAQANVQVNVGRTNELLDDDGEGLVS